MANSPSFRSGFVAVVGRPNVGKSTLLNHVVGQKVTIVSDKPQTTRRSIRCIWTTDDAQIVFIDTPGIHVPRNRLSQRMVAAASDALEGVDAVLFIVDGAAGPGRGDAEVARRLESVRDNTALLINKMDEVSENDRLAVTEAFQPLGSFAFVQGVSAKYGDGVDSVLNWLKGRMSPGPMYYPADWVVDHPEQFVVGELIREQALHRMEEEIPYGIAVVVEHMAERDDRHLMDVAATIYVERESQKGIVIGKGGSMLKQIGAAAREEIEKLLGIPVHLETWVKVSPNWRERERALAALGYPGRS